MAAIVEAEECTRARMTVSLALDGEAVRSELREAASHLDRCASCRGFAARVVAISDALRSLRAHARGERETTDTKGVRR